MDWSSQLEPEEVLRWEGRPAPRCYVFRHWRRSVHGLLLLLLATWWQAVSYPLGQLYDWPWLAWLPLPFVLFGLYFALGHLLLSRLEWEHVFYALTDRRLLVQRGLFRRRHASLFLDEVAYFQLRPLGEQLGTLRVGGSKPGRTLLLSCIEHPRYLSDCLEAILARNGKEVAVNRHQDSGARNLDLPET